MDDERPVTVLAVSGSLRRASSNRALIDAAVRLAPSGVDIAIYRDLEQINASARATHAWSSLAATLTVMSALVIREASITIPLDGRELDANGIVGDRDLSTALTSAIEALAAAVRRRQS